MPNLVKQRFIVSDNRQARVINSNDKLAEIYQNMNLKREDLQSPPEFEAGIFAERVELSEEYSEWAEESIGQNSEDVMVSEPDINVEEMLEDARREAEEIIRQASEEASAIKEEAYQEGFSEGQSRAQLLGQQAEETLRQQYGLKIEELEQIYNNNLEQMESQMVDVFVDIIEKVLTVELKEYSSIISELVLRTMKQLDNPKHVSISVNSQNYSEVKGKEAQLAEYLGHGAELEIIKDDKMSETQCKIETERGIYDCGYDVQLNNLLKKIKMLSIRS